MKAPPKPDIEVFYQLIDNEVGCYRLHVGSRVHYVTISADIFDEDTMFQPDLIIPKLPGLYNVTRAKAITSWNGGDGSLELILLTNPLPRVEMS